VRVSREGAMKRPSQEEGRDLSLPRVWGI
jgi:hypothetical protein